MFVLYLNCEQGFLTSSFLRILFNLLDEKQKKLFFKHFSQINNKQIVIKSSRKKIDFLCYDFAVSRSFLEVKKIVNSFKIDKSTKKIANKIFAVLAKTEAKVHDTTIKSVHFHEVGKLSNIARILAISYLLHKYFRLYPT